MQTSLRSQYQYYTDYGSLDTCGLTSLHHGSTAAADNHHLFSSSSLDQEVGSANNVNLIESLNNQHQTQVLHDNDQEQSTDDFAEHLLLTSQSKPEAKPEVQNLQATDQYASVDGQIKPGDEQIGTRDFIYDGQTDHYQSTAISAGHQPTENELDIGAPSAYQHQSTISDHNSTYQAIYYEPVFNDSMATMSSDAKTRSELGQAYENHQTIADYAAISRAPLPVQPPTGNSNETSGCAVPTYFQYTVDQQQTDHQLSLSNHQLEVQCPNLQQQQQLNYAPDVESCIGTTENHNQIYQRLEIVNHSFDLNQQQQMIHLQNPHPNFELDTMNPTGHLNEYHQMSSFPKHAMEFYSQQEAHHIEDIQNQQLQTHDMTQSEGNNLNYTAISSRSHAISRCLDSHHSPPLENPEASLHEFRGRPHSPADSSSSEESSASTLTRDEKKAREANIPIAYFEIVNLSIEQFNEQLAKYNLSESQLTLIKDIRRRGKNKVAAQICRKRKMEQIYELQHEVNQLVNKRRSLSFECSQLVKEHGDLVQEYNKIYTIIQGQLQEQQQQPQ